MLTALGNTFFYALLAVPAEMILALALASLLNSVRRGSGAFRTIFYLPKLTPVVATASVFLLLLNGNTGAINQFLGLFGIPGPQWLTDPAWVKPAIVIMSLWTVAGSMLILMAALQNVPRELYEAASVDGASRVRQFFSVTVPLISPTLFFLTIVNTIAALQVFDQAYLLFYRDGTSSAPDAALVLRRLPVPAGVPAVQLRPGRGHGLAAVRDHPGHHRHPAQGRQPTGALRGG